jgi:hypothetical protein
VSAKCRFKQDEEIWDMNKNNNNKKNVVTLLAAWWLADCQHDKSNIAKQQNTDFDYVFKNDFLYSDIRHEKIREIVLTWFIQLVDVECWLSGRSK